MINSTLELNQDATEQFWLKWEPSTFWQKQSKFKAAKKRKILKHRKKYKAELSKQ